MATSATFFTVNTKNNILLQGLEINEGFSQVTESFDLLQLQLKLFGVMYGYFDSGSNCFYGKFFEKSLA